ncbi:MAG: nicotinate (nicotinamide) nucleotide adenylyltransferase [Planctomycetes bacterium]|nr:nicotinate (nicotinamide) nucleotide adenylyltransferase [Planctomycetota bacterium]
MDKPINRVGIVGGSFDPPHFGHLELAQTAHKAFGFSKVLMLLTPEPPHKTENSLSNYKHRLNMLGLLIENNPKLEACTIEFERQGPHYTLETIRMLKQRNPEVDEYWLIVGSDTFKNLHTWYKPEILLREVKFCVAARPEFDIDYVSALKEIATFEKIDEIRRNLIPMKPKDISSTEIRRICAKGQRTTGMTFESIIDYIFEHNLYINR